MKSLNIYFFLILAGILGLALIAGCEGPMGPAGAPGPAGIDLTGFAPGIKCETCHSSDQDTVYFVASRRYQWASSTHAVGGRSERNAANCAGCHTSEGFQQMSREGWSTQVVNQVNSPSPPGCFACHSPHTRNNFSLRDSAAVTIASFIEGVPDATFDYGAGNLCVRCHQTRTASPMSPKPNPTKTAMTDTIVITSSRWYPHYGVHGQMLMGEGGFKFVDYTYTGNSNHQSNAILLQDGCAKCHMADPVGGGGGVVGGHTFKTSFTEGTSTVYNFTGCRDAACHGSSFSSFNYIGQSSGLTGGQGVQTYIKRYLDTLYTLMTDTNIVKKWNADGSTKKWLTISSSGSILVNASSSSPLRIRPASRAGALYNYWFLEHEGSHGVHNSKYAIELIQSSIAELRKP